MLAIDLEIEWESIRGLTVILGLAVASYVLVRAFVMPVLRRGITKTKFKWDDVLLDPTLLHRIGLAAPLIVFCLSISFLPELARMFPAAFPGDWTQDGAHHDWLDAGLRLSQSLLVLVIVMILSAALTAANTLYETFPLAKERPIKSYIQVIKIIVWIMGLILFLAVATDQQISYFVTGLGAMTAVLLLIFKDTILSLVASIQLIQNDMLRVGDWIEMPGQNLDGDVIDIALHTVKVQNFDKTITTIPTHSLISDSFRNWRGMSESGGRRIKRAISIDMSTIRFLTDKEIERFSRFAPLQKYMAAKREELTSHNASLSQSDDVLDDPRRLTNVGTFRAYIGEYLKSHPKLHQSGMTLLVRQLAPGPEGLPIEVYCFTNDTNWGNYEAIQADIFDHLLALLPEFDLKAFQQPTTGDFARQG